MTGERAKNMKATALQNILIGILRSELTETPPDASVREQITPAVIPALYSLANWHDLAHLVSSFLYKYGLLADEEMLVKFNEKAILSVYRNEQMNYAYTQICDTLDSTSVPYIPLKGAVIRPFYPQESVRTSCDIDILIKEKDLNAAVDALVQKGFKCGKKNYHNISLFSPADMHLELHFTIQENIDKLDAVLKDAWQYAKPVHGSRYEFTSEFFVFHMFAHMSYHFLAGGCGLKSLMDVWVMEHKMGLTYECARELLEKAGIYRFAAEIHKLAESCFSGTPRDEFSSTLLSYICRGGVYGTLQNNIAVKKTKTPSTTSYVLQRLFMPYKFMTTLYPVLKTLPFLLPFCWMARFCKMLFGGKAERTIAELKTASAVSDDKVQTVMQLRERLGL